MIIHCNNSNCPSYGVEREAVEDLEPVDSSCVLCGEPMHREDGQPLPVSTRKVAEDQEGDSEPIPFTVEHIDSTARLMLAESDWIVIRSVELQTPIPQEWLLYRSRLREIIGSDSTTVEWPELPGAEKQ